MSSGLQSSVWGMTRGATVVPGSPATEQELDVNLDGALVVGQGALPLEELVRQGGSYLAQAVSAVASVIAVPTTAAIFSLWNGEALGGKSYVIDSVLCTQIGAPATGYQFAVMGMLNRLAISTAPTAGPVPTSLSGQPNYRGKGRTVVSASGLTNDGWFAIGNGVSTQFATGGLPGMQLDIPLGGRIIIPPQQQLNLTCLAQAVTVTVLLGLVWHERQIMLG